MERKRNAARRAWSARSFLRISNAARMKRSESGNQPQWASQALNHPAGMGDRNLNARMSWIRHDLVNVAAIAMCSRHCEQFIAAK
jgi:hypothetical protein